MCTRVCVVCVVCCVCVCVHDIFLGAYLCACVVRVTMCVSNGTLLIFFVASRMR